MANDTLSTAQRPRRATNRGVAASRTTNEQSDTLRRLEDGLSNLAEGFSTQRENVSALKGHLEHLERAQITMAADWKSDLENMSASSRNDMSRFNVALEQFSIKLEARKFPSSILVGLASAGLLALGMLTGLAVFFVNAEISNAIQPVTNAQAAMLAQISNFAPRIQANEISSSTSSQADQRSQTDRADLSRRMLSEEQRNSTIEAEIAKIYAGNVEIETQFTGVKQQIYYMWEKVFGSPLPIVPRENPAAGSLGNKN
jgi:hypothetical protein